MTRSITHPAAVSCFGSRNPIRHSPPSSFDPGFAGDCIIVEGNLFAATNVDSYSILVEETLTLVVITDHSPGVNFNLAICLMPIRVN